MAETSFSQHFKIYSIFIPNCAKKKKNLIIRSFLHLTPLSTIHIPFIPWLLILRVNKTQAYKGCTI